MTPAALKAVVGTVTVVAAPILTAILFFVPLHTGAYEAAIVLATLAWNHAGTVIRSLFPGPEIDVEPKKEITP